MSQESVLPGSRLRGFGDASFVATDAEGESSSFSIGQLDLFMTSRLSGRFQVLAELVFEAGDDNAFVVDVERLLLEYSPGDYLRLGAGRYHTGIGSRDENDLKALNVRVSSRPATLPWSWAWASTGITWSRRADRGSRRRSWPASPSTRACPWNS